MSPVGIHGKRAAKDGAGHAEPELAGLVGHMRVESSAPGCVGHARPGDAVEGLVVAVIAHRGNKQPRTGFQTTEVAALPSGAQRHQLGPCTSAAAVGDGGQVPALRRCRRSSRGPRNSGRRVGVDHVAFVGLRNRGHDQLRIDGTPGKTGKALAGEVDVAIAQVILHVGGSRIRLQVLPPSAERRMPAP